MSCATLSALSQPALQLISGGNFHIQHLPKTFRTSALLGVARASQMENCASHRSFLLPSANCCGPRSSCSVHTLNTFNFRQASNINRAAALFMRLCHQVNEAGNRRVAAQHLSSQAGELLWILRHRSSCNFDCLTPFELIKYL